MNKPIDDIQAADQAVETIRRWGLRDPALISLEVGKPVAFLGAQMLYIASPLLHLFDRVSGRKVAPQAEAVAHLLENPAATTYLGDRLSEPEGEPR